MRPIDFNSYNPYFTTTGGAPPVAASASTSHTTPAFPSGPQNSAPGEMRRTSGSEMRQRQTFALLQDRQQQPIPTSRNTFPGAIPSSFSLAVPASGTGQLTPQLYTALQQRHRQLSRDQLQEIVTTASTALLTQITNDPVFSSNIYSFQEMARKEGDRRHAASSNNFPLQLHENHPFMQEVPSMNVESLMTGPETQHAGRSGRPTNESSTGNAHRLVIPAMYHLPLKMLCPALQLDLDRSGDAIRTLRVNLSTLGKSLPAFDAELSNLETELDAQACTSALLESAENKGRGFALLKNEKGWHILKPKKENPLSTPTYIPLNFFAPPERISILNPKGLAEVRVTVTPFSKPPEINSVIDLQPDVFQPAHSGSRENPPPATNVATSVPKALARTPTPAEVLQAARNTLLINYGLQGVPGHTAIPVAPIVARGSLDLTPDIYKQLVDKHHSLGKDRIEEIIRRASDKSLREIWEDPSFRFNQFSIQKMASIEYSKRQSEPEATG